MQEGVPAAQEFPAPARIRLQNLRLCPGKREKWEVVQTFAGGRGGACQRPIRERHQLGPGGALANQREVPTSSRVLANQRTASAVEPCGRCAGALGELALVLVGDAVLTSRRRGLGSFWLLFLALCLRMRSAPPPTVPGGSPASLRLGVSFLADTGLVCSQGIAPPGRSRPSWGGQALAVRPAGPRCPGRLGRFLERSSRDSREPRALHRGGWRREAGDKGGPGPQFGRGQSNACASGKVLPHVLRVSPGCGVRDLFPVPRSSLLFPVPYSLETVQAA